MLTVDGPVTTRQDSAERIDRVLWHIENSLADDLSLAVLADVACYSPEHLHRLFVRTVGETPLQCVNRTRLENALNYLMYCPLRSIGEIALESGFSTPAYFSTAFRKHFGVTPRQWKEYAYRNANNFWQHRSPHEPPAGSTASAIAGRYRRFPEPKESLPGVEIVTLPRKRIAVLRSTGGYTPAAVRSTWLAMYRWARSRGIWRPGTAFGVLRSNPLVTRPRRCMYYAAVELTGDVVSDGVVRVLEAPENTYALHRHTIRKHRITESELVSVYLRFYHRWMEEAGMEPFHLRSIEIMPDTFPVVTWKGKVITLGIPVRPARLYPDL